ncbi:MAG: 4-(cytidine 5'-diphospho)-2-C-methyl-D-erythritol kinase [Clostridia bacterium]|nr:4-(cytidine 5'-diphospho)-2-C-methyl-D-erythritol kinase [Clostridia bacterium]
MKITLSAPAKINLFLDITACRPDGYHEIAGVMQSISLCDTVTVEVTEPTGMYLCSLGNHTAGAESITLTCTNPDLPADSRNLAWRAAEKFFAATGRGCKSLSIHIEKRIPAAAGMAGGSTDAAAVLVGLNDLFGHPLTPAALCEVGLTLGADVPFCIMGGAQITEGIGEALTPITPMPACGLVVACGGEGVSTPAAYKALDTLYGSFDPAAYTPRARELTALKSALWQGNLTALCGSMFNLFESVVLPDRPVARQIKETLLSAGAVTAMMSGSGPSVFGVFPKGDGSAEKAREALEALGIPAWVCEPIRR